MGSYNRATFLTSVYPLHHMQVLKLDEVITHVSPSPAHFTLIRFFIPLTGCIDRLDPSFHFPPFHGLVALCTSGSAFLVREIFSVGLFTWVLCCFPTSKHCFFVQTCLPLPGMVIIYINIYKYFFSMFVSTFCIFFSREVIIIFLGSGFKTCM